jgi:hypothetical protein
MTNESETLSIPKKKIKSNLLIALLGIILVLIVSLFSVLALGVSGDLPINKQILNPSTTKDNRSTEANSRETRNTTEPEESIPATEKGHQEPEIPPSGSNSSYLPKDAPFNESELETLYKAALDRYNIFYMEDSSTEEEFKKRIEPYLKLFLASSEYTFKTYGEIFQSNNTELDERESISIKVYEECTDISASVSEDVCKEAILVGSASPFTLGFSFYANLDNPKLNEKLLISNGMHETIHVLQYTYQDGDPGTTTPKWYRESMAEGLMYNSDQQKDVHPELFQDLTYPQNLEELEGMYRGEGEDTEINNMRKAYYIGQEFYHYLITKTTLEKYVTLIPVKFGYLDNDFGDAFEEIFGQTSEELYQEFLQNKV